MWQLWREKFVPAQDKDTEEGDEEPARTEAHNLLAAQAPVDPEEQLRPEDLGLDDLGVSAESKLSPEQLREAFGMPNEGWFGFNTYQHAGTLNPWDNEGEWKKLMEDAEEQEKGKVITRFVMKWHQLVGVRAMVRLTLSAGMTEKEREGKGYVLLADGVGAGKTCQVIGFITLLKHLRVVTKQGLARPSVFRE
jgi:SNF2 family DNA or RNA helicase